MRVVVLALMILASLLVVPPSSAQESQDYTLWMHNGGGTLFFSTDANDPANTANTLYKNFIGMASGDITYTPASRDVLVGDMPLRPGETIHVELAIGDTGGWLAAWGSFSLTCKLSVNGETVATCPSKTISYSPGAGAQWHKAAWDLEHTLDVVPAAADVRLEFTASGQASGYAVSVRGASGQGFIQFPGQAPVPAAPALVSYEDLPTPAFNGTWVNATTGTHHLNFTHEGDADLVIGGNITSGSATFLLRDAGNLTVFEADLAGLIANGSSVAAQLRNVTAGLWQASINMTDFVGNLTMALVAPASLDAGLEEGNGTTAAGSTQEQTAETEPLDASDGVAGQESPGLSLVLVGLAMLAARRR